MDVLLTFLLLLEALTVAEVRIIGGSFTGALVAIRREDAIMLVRCRPLLLHVVLTMQTVLWLVLVI